MLEQLQAALPDIELWEQVTPEEIAGTDPGGEPRRVECWRGQDPNHVPPTLLVVSDGARLSSIWLADEFAADERVVADARRKLTLHLLGESEG